MINHTMNLRLLYAPYSLSQNVYKCYRGTRNKAESTNSENGEASTVTDYSGKDFS